MQSTYIPVLIYAVLVMAFPAVTLVLAKFIRPASTSFGAKLKPYECGIPPESDARGRYSVRFYIVAMLKPHRISPACIALRWNSALIGLQLRPERRGCRPNKLCKNQRHRGKRNHQHRVDQHRNVCALHRSLTRSILPPLS